MRALGPDKKLLDTRMRAFGPDKKLQFLERGVWRSHQLWVRGHRVRTEPARAGSVVFWGARCAAWPIVKPLPKKNQKK